MKRAKTKRTRWTARDIANMRAGTCPECQGVYGVRVPRMGDGSAVVMRHHGIPTDKRRRCPGVGMFRVEDDC